MPTFIAGEIVSAAKLNAATSRDWAAWTPTLTNLAVGTTGTVQARWVAVGTTIHFYFEAVLGGTGISVGAARFSLPTTASSSYVTQAVIGVGTFVDVSAGTSQFGLARANSTTEAGLFFLNNVAVQNVVSSSAPFAWATTDIIALNGTYEGA